MISGWSIQNEEPFHTQDTVVCVLEQTLQLSFMVGVNGVVSIDRISFPGHMSRIPGLRINFEDYQTLLYASNCVIRINKK